MQEEKSIAAVADRKQTVIPKAKAESYFKRHSALGPTVNIHLPRRVTRVRGQKEEMTLSQTLVSGAY